MIKINSFNSDQKILKHLDKLDYFLNGHKTLVVAELDLTNKCNNRCPYCCGIKENGAQLTKKQIDMIANGLYEMGAKGVILSGGGQPLISPHFEYAVRQLKQNGIKLGLNSNGLALTKEKALIISEYFEYFRVSLDAGSPQMYQITHGMPNTAYKKVIENAKLFSKIRNESDSKTSFGIGFLTSKLTENDMENFVLVAKECGADFAQFRPFTGDTYDLTGRIEKLQKSYNDDTFIVNSSIQKYREMHTKGKREYTKCRGMFFSTVITADAKVFACLHYRQEDRYFLGQISKNNSLEDIFKSSLIRKIFESIDCKECPTLCRNDAFNRTLDTLSLDINNSEFM